MDDPKRTVHVVGDPTEVSFIWNDEGEIVEHITIHPSVDGFSISIYDEPMPPLGSTMSSAAAYAFWGVVGAAVWWIWF